MYTFQVTTLGGANVSELPGATARRFTAGLAGLSVASVTVRGGSDTANFLMGGDALLKVYETDDYSGVKTLLAHQRLITAEEVAGEDRMSVSCTFADPLWTLGARLVGKSADGYSRGTSLSLVDRGTIMGELVTAANAEAPTGVTVGTITPSSSTYVAGWTYKPLSECLAELGAPLDGPDWRIVPIEYTGGAYGRLEAGPALATYRPDAAFEFGDGRLNVRDYRRLVNIEGTRNRLYSLPEGFPNNAVGSVLQVDDATSQATRGLLEAVVPSDVTIDELRQALLNAHLKVRRGARQVVTFTPIRDLGQRVPKYGRDFMPGDVVPFRVTTTNPDTGRLVKRIDVTTRIYSYDVSIDDAGYGSPTLTTTPV